MQDAQQDGALTIAEAAAQLGVSADTVRRRIRRGELAAVQVHTPNGPAWRVTLGAVHSATSTVGSNAHSAVHTLDGTTSVDGEALRDLVALVDRLQTDVVSKAEAAAMWQTRAELLAVQLQQRERDLADTRAELQALHAPKNDVPEIVPQRASDNVASDTTGTSSETPRRVPWWAPWRRVNT